MPSRTKTELEEKIAARDPQAKPGLIDLSGFYNELLTGFVGERDGNDLSTLPRGLQTFSDIPFDVRGVIQLSSRGIKPIAEYPEQVKGIKVGRVCQRLHFLHASRWVRAADGTVLGKYVLNYRDGNRRELPIIYGTQVRDWWSWENQPPTDSVVAWQGANRDSTANGLTIRLFKTTWPNPLPQIEIESIDYISSMAGPAPFLVALTVE